MVVVNKQHGDGAVVQDGLTRTLYLDGCVGK